MTNASVSLRHAGLDDVAEIQRFGQRYIPLHYSPLIGAQEAQAQVDNWWSADQLTSAISSRCVIVAENASIIAVGQRGRMGDDHVIYKLYVAAEHRGHGLGPRLIEALLADLPSDTPHVLIEHFVGNERAGAFYEREGFLVDRIEPSQTIDHRLGVVWRRLTLPQGPKQRI